MKERSVRILEILANNNNIKITLLAELLDVSQVTLRKDLDNLEKLGIINRIHGYASLDNADETARRMAFCYTIKCRIAEAAARTVKDDETIMLESGSCCAIFAEELAKLRKNVTIITNSIFITEHIRRKTNIKIILLGGHFQPESQVLIGSMTVKSAAELFPDKFFLGADSFIPGQGFTGTDHFRVETASGLAKCAKKIFVLTEAAKFLRRGAFSLISLDCLTGVFTDDTITKEAEADLHKNNVQLIKVSSAEEKLKWRQFPDMLPILYNKRKE